MPATPVTDRRIARTRLALRDAMLHLLPERGWDELNIQQICEQANVGRSTFYIHYRSKDDLLAESLNDLRDALSAATPHHPGPQQPLGFMPGLMAHMTEHRRVFKAVVGRRSGHGIERRFRETVFQLVESGIAKQKPLDVKSRMVARYIAGGVVDLMAWWVDAPGAPAVDELEKLMQALACSALDVPQYLRPARAE